MHNVGKDIQHLRTLTDGSAVKIFSFEMHTKLRSRTQQLDDRRIMRVGDEVTRAKKNPAVTASNFR